jgi:hypothetical protein
MNRPRLARAIRDLARSLDTIADEIAPPAVDEIEPALEPEELRAGLEQLRSIELEGVLSRALNFTARRTPRC